MQQPWIVAGTAVAGLALAGAAAWLIAPDSGAEVERTPSVATPAPARDTDPPAVRPSPPPRRMDFPVFEDTDAPPPPRPPPPMPVGVRNLGPDEVAAPATGPLPPDVRGVERLFSEQHPDAVKVCARLAGLEPEPGEIIQLLLTIVPNGETSSIQVLQAADDAAGRYTGVLTCLARELEGTVFDVIPQGTPALVRWGVQP